MMVRSAELSDYEAISAIRDELVLDIARLRDPAYTALVERNGFLAPVELSREDFSEDVEHYMVGEMDDAVVGFLRLDDKQEMEPEEVPVWIDPAMEGIYWAMPHASIGKLAVSPRAGRRGVASALLAEAEKRTQEKRLSYLFSFIVTCRPPTNYPSIRFHTKNGFQKIAPLETQVAYGIQDYRATLYGKKLPG